MTKLRAADVLARRLYAAGCRRAYGMPGGEVLTLVHALEAAGIEFVLGHHETAAGFMAEGGHHMDGAPAILVATVGPGAMNAVNFVANAEQDRVPVIVLTGCIDPDDAETYNHQLLDQRGVFAPITKATFTLTPGAAAVQVDKAVRIATGGAGGRAGPVHIDVPISVADAIVPDSEIMRPHAAAGAIGAEALATARAWLAKAERPIMLAGLDAVRDGAADAIRAFCETHDVPLVTSYKGKGLLPEDHRLSLGGAGLSPLADTHLLPFFREADLILLAGYDPIEMRPGWRTVWDPSEQNVIDICHASNLHGMHGATLEVIAPVGTTLDAIRDGVAPRPVWDVSEARAALRAAFAVKDWGPDAIVAACREACPPGTVATVDSGAHRILLSQIWECDGPHQLLQSTGLCTMGCALPLAIGAKRAAPETPVIAFMGDAGFLMVTGELASASKLGLPVVFVVFVDRSLSLIELKQRQRQLPNAGVDFDGVDFAAIARGFGGNGVTVHDANTLRAEVEAALSSDTFTVIAAEFDRKAYDGRF
ncbi:thiamine pyrophosphate-binding protein [Jannaschia seohaensis]|uniref:Acetolactate synthase-1/2/3 large subunit n=1 Tax=Jannaschia seohaensis TaxID=475081 RepID=A0A2Y9B2W3_9RHOB|nr:thiamine pyrophosphate-binding protein [Jannaschia seohaensis]PWJ13792.1 acetolactate synthase-1/2/3 large subunit [Jannaschia seohaensis]SSA50305.1 acetolactate synthase-1/2/3 large subunit [Jannaschia seohaensis]